jgi:hypothetical protein
MNAVTLGDAAPPRGWTTWVFNPFHYIAGGQALGVGLVAILIAGCVNWKTGSHFDGVLDFHGGAITPLWVYWVEGPINWLIMGALLLLAGKLLSRSRIRAVDVFGTQALARFPTLIMAISVLPPPVQRANQQIVQAAMAMQSKAASGVQVSSADLFRSIAPFDLILFAAAILTILVMIVWLVALMYRAFAVSCNVSGGKAIGTFVVLLLVGEVVSKVIFGILYNVAVQ